MSSVKDLGPLDWRTPIVDPSGRPSPEFQRRWDTQRNNNALIGGVTIGSGPPTGTPKDGAEYVDIALIPNVLYVGSAGAWVKVGVYTFLQLSDVPHDYTGSAGYLVRVSGSAGLEFDSLSTTLDTLGATQGDLLYRSAAGWVVLAPGTVKQMLQSGGAGANPSWTSDYQGNTLALGRALVAGDTVSIYSTSTLRFNNYGDGVNLAYNLNSYGTGKQAFFDFQVFRGTFAAPTAVATGDALGTIAFAPYDGASNQTVAKIMSFIDTYTTTNNLSAYLAFYTRPDGVGGPLTERLRIDKNGVISVAAGTIPIANQAGLIGGGGGGYSPGTPPTVVQVAHATSSTAVTFGAAPTNGNLLVAFTFNPTGNTAQAGWTKQIEDAGGTDWGNICTKTAGVAEPTTQQAMTASASGGVVMYELHKGSGTPAYVAGATQTELSGSAITPALLPNAKDCIGIGACSLVTGTTFVTPVLLGTQDVLDNTGNRHMLSVHSDLGGSPNIGVMALLSGVGTYKGASGLFT